MTTHTNQNNTPPRKPKRASHTERTDLYPKPTIRKFSWEPK